VDDAWIDFIDNAQRAYDARNMDVADLLCERAMELVASHTTSSRRPRRKEGVARGAVRERKVAKIDWRNDPWCVALPHAPHTCTHT
jgi:hypothetical protein